MSDDSLHLKLLDEEYLVSDFRLVWVVAIIGGRVENDAIFYFCLSSFSQKVGTKSIQRAVLKTSKDPAHLLFFLYVYKTLLAIKLISRSFFHFYCVLLVQWWLRRGSFLAFPLSPDDDASVFKIEADTFVWRGGVRKYHSLIWCV